MIIIKRFVVLLSIGLIFKWFGLSFLFVNVPYTNVTSSYPRPHLLYTYKLCFRALFCVIVVTLPTQEQIIFLYLPALFPSLVPSHFLLQEAPRPLSLTSNVWICCGRRSFDLLTVSSSAAAAVDAVMK